MHRDDERAISPVLLLAACAVAVSFSACMEPRDFEGERIGPVYRMDVAPRLAQACVSCHGPDRREGNYDLSTYNGVLGGGSDEVPNAIAGDPDSRLLTVIAPDAAAPTFHQPDAAFFRLLERWVVEARLAYFHDGVHPPGFLNPSDPTFHGAMIAQLGWDLTPCQGCHGEDYAGGGAGRSCNGCHPGTPEGCGTCHGQGENPAPPTDLSGRSDTASPGVGAHQPHLMGSSLRGPIPCESCHEVPQTFSAPHHRDGKVDVVFHGLAVAQGADPLWNEGSATCQGVYCHGGAFEPAAQGNDPEPVWTQVDGSQATCVSCHAFPPHPDIPEGNCSICHGRVVDADLGVVGPSLHIDGYVEFGDGSNGCHACHGDETSPAPPRDLSGGTERSRLGVGAHRIHLSGGPIAAGFPCESCHERPKRITAEGHIDSPLPAEVTFRGLAAFTNDTFASAREAPPRWDRERATCENVYCHGDTLVEGGGSLTRPVWTVDDGSQAACGTCHGLPPVANHRPENRDCSLCHGNVVDADLGIIDGEKHVNGQVDF